MYNSTNSRKPYYVLIHLIVFLLTICETDFLVKNYSNNLLCFFSSSIEGRIMLTLLLINASLLYPVIFTSSLLTSLIIPKLFCLQLITTIPMLLFKSKIESFNFSD